MEKLQEKRAIVCPGGSWQQEDNWFVAAKKILLHILIKKG